MSRSSEQLVNRGAVVQAMDDMLNEGHGVAAGALDDFTVTRLEREIDRLHWSLPDEELRGNGSRRTLYLQPRSLFEATVLSSFVTPTIRTIAKQFGETVQEEGIARGVPQLAGWSPNEAVVNIIPGSEGQPGFIRPHTDPSKFHGFVGVFGLAKALVGIDDEEPVEVGRGALELFMCHDLAEKLKLPQRKHWIITHNKRNSVALINDSSAPKTLRYGYETWQSRRKSKQALIR